MSASDVLAPIERRLRLRVGAEDVEDLGTLHRRDFLRFALAAGDTTYLELVAALPEGELVPAPVLYLPGTLHWAEGPAESELRPDGLSDRDAPGVEDEAVNVMHGGQDIRFLDRSGEGMRVEARRHLRAVDRKAGRSGDFLVVTTTTEFVADGVARLALGDDVILVVPR
jgi:hypothetical protein